MLAAISKSNVLDAKTPQCGVFASVFISVASACLSAGRRDKSA